MENFDNSKKRIREEEDEYLDSLSPAPFLAGGDNIIKSAHQFKSSHANIGSTPEIPSNAINLLINSNPQSKDASPSNAPCVPANSIYDDGNDADKSVTYDTENIGSTQKFNFDNNRLNTDNTHLKTKEPLFEDELSRSRAKNGEEEEEYDNYENVHEKLVENPPIENDNNLPALKPRKLVLQKYTVYETDERMYIIGSNNRETMFRILEIDLTSPMENLNVIEDNVYFNRKEIIQILSTLEETKNLAKRISCYGLLGFVKFTKHYYLQTVTERSIVGILGGHYIYKIDSTKLVPIICEAGFNTYKKSTSKEELDNEQRFLSIFEGFSLDENFYFSYTYDISNTLQKNFLNEKFKAFQNKVSQKVNKGQNSKNQDDRDAYGISNSSVLNNSTSLHEASRSMNDEKHVNNKSNLKNREDASTNYTDSELELNEVDNEELVQKLLGTDEEAENYLGVYNEMFVWNTALLRPAVKVFDRTFDWFQPVIHGFFNQANISIYNKKIYITLIARRSHHFAGARFLKRGVNDKGNVANEVETEQIVCDGVTTSFHDPTNGFCMNSNYSSFVQHRGSIPLYWTQDITNINKIAKPPIIIKLTDPFYSTSALHFDKLFKRYGPKISILNLIKQKEKTARESKLGKEFRECIDFLNHSLPEAHKLDYVAWDMSRASKTGSHGQAVLEFLETYADTVIDKVGLFHNSTTQNSDNLQIGVCRTNCIDCLDRTNAAQLIIGKKALGYQLKKLGIYDNVFLEYDSDAVNLLTTLYQKHGNTIALQYGGSNLVNTMETYRKINQWSSKKNDLIENVKRFYSNSFVDPLRQDTINLFLGNYSFEKLGSKFFLWDLPNDYYLHNDIGISKLHSEKMRSFSFWWNENVLKYWKNIQFPPRNYLLNGELDDFALNKNSRLYDKKSFENAVRKILAELIIDQDLSLTTKRVFTAENASKFTGFRIRFRNSKGKKKSKRPKGKQFFVSRLNELAEMISNIDQSLFLIEYKAKLYKDTKLEPYYGKQTDSYWGEYYAPRKLTNFKLLFDMNMKSSLTIDAKELSGAHFADENSKATDGSGIVLTKEDHGNDINPNSTVDPNTSYNSHLNFTSTNNYGTQGDTSFAGATNSSASPFDYANSKLQTPLFEVSPFESRKPGLINQKFRQLYKHETGSFGKANDRNSKPVKLEKEEIAAKLAEIDDFMKFLWPSLTRYDIDDDSVEQDLEASLINGLEQETDQDEENALSLSILQLKLVIKANEYLNSYIFNLCKDLYGSLAYSYNYLENEETEEMDFDHEKSDEDYHSDTSVSHYETGYESDYNYNIKDNNKRHFHHIYRSPKHKKKQKTKKHQSEKQKQKKKLDHQHPSRQNKLLSGKSMNYTHFLSFFPNNINLNRFISIGYDSSQKGSSKMLADGRSQSNNKSISPGASSRASHPAPKRQYSTYSLPSRLPGGVSRQSKLNSKHVTNNYIDITTKGYEPSILSSSTNNHSCSNYEDYLFAPYIPPKSLEMYHENVSLKEPEYFYSELKDTTRNQSNEKVFKDSNYKTHDYDADDTAIFSNEYELQDDKYGLETIIMNPSIYREKYQEYQFSISIEQHGDILQKDLDIYKFSLGIGEPHTNKTAVSSGFGNHGSKNYYGSDVGNDENPTYSHFDNTQSVHYTNSLNNAYFGHGNDPGDETYDTVPYPDAYSNDYAESAESNGNESIYESILKNSLQYVDLRASNSSFPEKGKDVYHDASENFEGWGYEDGGVGGRNENVMKFYDIYAFQN